jgi:hypothetical protein
MTKAESLLPGTDALPRATIEWTKAKGKHLIRYRRPDGQTWQKFFDTQDEAAIYQRKCLDDLRAIAAQRKG